jgi:hypothetical protein
MATEGGQHPIALLDPKGDGLQKLSDWEIEMGFGIHHRHRRRMFVEAIAEAAGRQALLELVVKRDHNSSANFGFPHLAKRIH